jgi:hypothetical protein
LRVEKALDQQEIALGTFLDTERAFNNACYDAMCDDLVRHGSEYTIVRWIKATLESRLAVGTVNDVSLRFAISRGCPQEGVLSPLLWCLVEDGLLTRLAKPSQSCNWGAETCAKRKSTSPCLFAIPAFDRMDWIYNIHLNSNRGICLR